MAAYRIEAGRPEDIKELASLYDDLIDYLQSHTNWPGWRKGVYPTIRTAEEGVESRTLFVVRDPESGTIAGTVRLTHEPETAYSQAAWKIDADYSELIVIHTLAVHAVYMKNGISRMLMDFAEAHGCQLGMKGIRLDVSIHNQPAIRLYESCGYRYIGTVDLELGIPELKWFRLYELPL